MSWTRVDIERLSRRRIAPAVPAALAYDEHGWVRSWVTQPVDPPDETLEPDRWLRPAT